MIVDALIAQLQQRFEFERRARVCLWFDEKREFLRLLPALQRRLETNGPLRLLAYDADAQHGQIWIKHQVYRASAPPETADRRCVVYLPLAEDRLDAPDEDGRHHLELLAEYRVAGVVWRIGGKPPTLFAFLRQAGVRLPDSPAEQRRLWTGGENSLLAKYVATWAERPEGFRDVVLTPELVQSRLVGDVEQAVMQLAAAPQEQWAELQARGLAAELLSAVAERYGFQAPSDDPARWVRELVATLALTEAYLGYAEPADFPFADRLPPAALRPAHVQFLQRWLRDAEHRPVWDRWISEVEESINLRTWASGREGFAFGFPHLVQMRWDTTVAELEHGAGKTSETDAFYAQRGALLRREAEFAKASLSRVGAWDVFDALGRFTERCRDARGHIAAAENLAALAALYVQEAPLIDGRHVALRRQALEHDLPVVGRVADRAYGGYAKDLNQRFSEMAAAAGSLAIDGIPTVTPHLEATLWQAAGRRAVIIADALRLDCAHAIRSLLGQSASVEPMRAALPTVTAVGMTALMPIGGATVTLEAQGSALRPRVNGRDMAARQNRLEYLRAFSADCRDIDELEATSSKPDGIGELLVVFGHEAVDAIGHGDGVALIRHLDIEVRRLAQLVRKLHRWDYPSVHIVTDHGFVLLDEEHLPPEVACDRDWCTLLKERFALVPPAADLPVATFASDLDAGVRVAVPPGLAFFKAEKSFSHGGASLQELIIPHLVSRADAPRAQRLEIEVVPTAFTLMQAAVRVVVRGRVQRGDAQQMSLVFGARGRTLSLDVLHTDEAGKRRSVLADGRAKEMDVNAGDRSEVAQTLFFHSALHLRKGESLDLEIRDVETEEQFPPGGIRLTVGRDL